MNKIIVENDILISTEVDSSIQVSFLEKTEEFIVNKLVIDVLKDTTLEIIYHNQTAFKLDILIRIREGVKAKIQEFRTGNLMKILYRYELDNHSELNLQKFHYIKGMKELDNIYLYGENSKIDYRLKTIATAQEKYDITVYHQGKKTESFLTTNGVSIEDGTLDFHISGIVPNGKCGSVVNQNNRIMNLNERKCSIHPNLFIDENDVSANHSAWIGTLRREELFYLQSRGLRKEEAICLLVKGFLLSNLDLKDEQKQKIENIIHQYWR